MKFRYRGAEYQDLVAANEPLEANHVTESYSAQYRGQAYQVSRPNQVPSQAASGLAYRGAPYRVTATGQTETLSPRERAAMGRPTPNPVRVQSPLAVHTRDHLADTTSQVHRKSIANYLEHRMRIARAKRDLKLMNQLEAEMRALGGV
jgi:hypothetical protein